MPPVKPLAPRHYSEDVGNKLVITIPSRKNWFIIIFLGIWLTGWTFGGIMAGGSIIVSIINNSKFDGPFPFIFISQIGRAHV